MYKDVRTENFSKEEFQKWVDSQYKKNRIGLLFYFLFIFYL